MQLRATKVYKERRPLLSLRGKNLRRFHMHTVENRVFTIITKLQEIIRAIFHKYIIVQIIVKCWENMYFDPTSSYIYE